MMRSMFSAVSGLRGFQTMMDVVGNNIANVNTAGYKSSQVTFQEALAQLVRAPGQGINPMEIGLGVNVASIDSVFTQGASQVTGRSTDLAIQGDGFFVVQNGADRMFTRAGAFGIDPSGFLVTSEGHRLRGWTADAAGNVQPNSEAGSLVIPVGQTIPGQATTSVTLGGNLSAEAAIGDVVRTSIVVYDSIGTPHQLVLELAKTGVNEWAATGSIQGTPYSVSPATLTFGTDGQLTGGSPMTFSGFTPDGAEPLDVEIDLQGPSSLVQFGGPSSAEASRQDGQPVGALKSFGISSDGSVVGQFSNGQTKLIGVVALANFANPAGLLRAGESYFSASVNSGQALIGTPGTAGRGMLQAGALEMSNVDLAREFTNLIVAQRGFQANSRVISASDELLADLVNLKR